jgi:hypothetical protein
VTLRVSNLVTSPIRAESRKRETGGISGDMFQSIVVGRTIVILGVLNFVLAASIFLSCRCLPGSRIGRNLMKNRRYKRFFGYHCHLWAIFWPSVAVHAFLAIMYLGWPR